MDDISPWSHITDPEHRALADQLAAKAGLEPNDITELHLCPDGRWLATVLDRDEDGQPTVTDGFVTHHGVFIDA